MVRSRRPACTRTYPTRSHTDDTPTEKPSPATPLVVRLTKMREQGSQFYLRLQQVQRRLESELQVPLVLDLTERELMCQICSQALDASDRLPISLPCGHTLCRICVRTIRKNGPRALCPYDRYDFSLEAESLQPNEPVLSLLMTRGKKQAMMCNAHQQPIVCFCLLTKTLKCGLCLLQGEMEGCYAPLSAPEVTTRKHEIHSEILKFIDKGRVTLGLWHHSEELLDLFLSSPSELTDPAANTKQLASCLDDILDLAEDLLDLVESITSLVSKRIHQYQVVKRTWGLHSLYQQFSVRFEDVLGEMEVVDLLRICRKMLRLQRG